MAGGTSRSGLRDVAAEGVEDDVLGLGPAAPVGAQAVGLVMAQVLRWVFRHVMGDDLLSVTVSLVAGYAASVPAEELGVSGVIAASCSTRSAANWCACAYDGEVPDEIMRALVRELDLEDQRLEI